MASTWVATCGQCAWTSDLRGIQILAEAMAQQHERDQPGHATAIHNVQGRKVIRILVVDDHSVMRKALCTLLAQERDLQIVGEVGDGKLAVEMAGALRPDVVLMDIDMPAMTGIEATRAIRAEWPAIQVVSLSMSEHADQAQPMLEAGAAGYVCKTEAPEVLLAAIRRCGADPQFPTPDAQGAALRSADRFQPAMPQKSAEQRNPILHFSTRPGRASAFAPGRPCSFSPRPSRSLPKSRSHQSN
jgi:DNA-binding NarL/FixJ family response regulator